MTSYKDLVELIDDIQNFSEITDFPQADKLIKRARLALKEDAVCYQIAIRQLAKNNRSISAQRLS